MMSDVEYMRLAVTEAQAAAAAGEVPVGAIIVYDNRIAARAGNRTIACCDPTAHAEIVALRAAAQAMGNYRMPGQFFTSQLSPASCAPGP